MSRELISTGNELAALAAVDSKCEFFGGYPITPSSEIMHSLSSKLPAIGGVCIQMEDEIGGICSALGAAMSGKRSMTASSGPGISLKSENLGLGYIAEVPLVVINVMRGGPSTGLPTRVAQGDILQAKNPTHGDVKSITLMPGNLTECYTEVVRAFNLADRFMQPVFVLLDETIGHMAGKVSLPDLNEIEKERVHRKRFDGDKKDYLPYGVKENEPAVLNPMFEGYRYHFTGLHHGPTGHPTEDGVVCDALMKRLFKKVEDFSNELESNEEYMLDDADILIIAYGSVSLGAKEAVNRLRKEGIKAGMFRPKTIWPSPEKRINELVNKFDKVLVAELNMGQYSAEIQRASGRKDFHTLLKENERKLTKIKIIKKVKGI